MKHNMKSSKMAKKANALKGFLNSMGKKKGEMGMGMTPPSNKITSSQSKSLGVAKGTPYKTTSSSSDKINTVRTSFNSPPRNSAEINAYMQSKNKPAMKSSMKKGGSFPDLTGDGKITRADVLKGRGVFKKGGMSKMANEGFKNAKRTITDGYKGTGAPNPLAAIVKNTATKKATIEGLRETVIPTKKKPKMQMGGAFFPQNPLTASKYQKDTLMGQSFKKGGMIKKKK